MAEGSEALFGWTPGRRSPGRRSPTSRPRSRSPRRSPTSRTSRPSTMSSAASDTCVKYRDGTTFPAEITSVSVWEDGQFAGVQGTVRDVTQQERLERELRESQERYRFLVENSPDVVFATDAEGLFTFMSESMERMTGWKPEEVIGAPFLHDRRARQHARDARPAGRRSWPIRRRSRSRTSTSRDRTAGWSRSRSAPSRWSTTKAGSPASTARRATSASGRASNASCASPRSATATSSPRRRTSSG